MFYFFKYTDYLILVQYQKLGIFYMQITPDCLTESMTIYEVKNRLKSGFSGN